MDCRRLAVGKLASSWDTYEFGAGKRMRGQAGTRPAASAAAHRPRGVPVYLPPLHDVPGVDVHVEIAGVPETALLTAGRALPSGVWLLDRHELSGLRILPVRGTMGRPVSLEVTFVATDRATGRSGSMITTVDIPAVWPAAGPAAWDSMPRGESVGGDGAGGCLRYSLADDAGGRFEIDPVSGLVAVADESLLDPATARRYRIAVRMAFADGQIVTRQYEIELLDDAGEFAVTELWDRNAGRRSPSHGLRAGAAVGTVSVPADDAWVSAPLYLPRPAA
jgi:hypothetical protein